MYRKPLFLAFALCVMVMGISLWSSVPAQAATNYIVTTNVDALDANPGDGICQSQNNGCTLRAAVAEINAGKGDRILLAANTVYTLSGVELYFSSPASVIGKSGTVIDGDNVTRLIRLTDESNLLLQNLTLRRGKADDGAALQNLGGTLWLERVEIISSHATHYGGAIYSDGSTVLYNVTLQGNSAAQLGGAIYNAGVLDAASTTLNGNSAALYHGGGVYSETGGVTHLTNSTITGNTAGTHGGGVYGGINSTTELYNTTVVNNKADTQDTNQGGGGGAYNFGGTFKIFNSVLAFNLLKQGNGSGGNDCDGTAISASYSLIRLMSDCTVTNTGGSFFNLDPEFVGLSDWGGLTETYSLKPNSPLIDFANPNGCKGYGGHAIAIEQRGYTRVVDGNNDGTARCDIGSFEYRPETANCAGKPNKPVQTKPGNGSIIKKTNVKLDWQDEPCAINYKVVVRMDSKKGPKVVKNYGLSESKFKTEPLEPGHTYYWKVFACNLVGCTKSKSSSFTLHQTLP